MYSSELRKRDVNHIDELQESQNDNIEEKLLSATALAAMITTTTNIRETNDKSMKEYERKYCSIKRNNNTQMNKMWRNELEIKTNNTSSQPEIRSNRLVSLYTMFVKSFYHKYWLSDLIDIFLRIVAVVVFAKLERSAAFVRKIHIEELWLYKNPRMPDIVTPTELLVSVICIPWLTTLLFYYFKKDVRDFRAASWTWTLGLCLNGLITTTLKITFGRPRPDFFYRCFPNGIMVLKNVTDPTGITDILNCTGNFRDINEGRKSFPSGHASFAFTSFSFIAFYIGTKLHAFDVRGRGQTWRLCLAVAPFAVAALIAVSRTCDYHHHWQDVVVGGIIGLMSSYLSYRQYYPSIFDINSHRALPRFVGVNISKFNDNYQQFANREQSDQIEKDLNINEETNALLNSN